MLRSLDGFSYSIWLYIRNLHFVFILYNQEMVLEFFITTGTLKFSVLPSLHKLFVDWVTIHSFVILVIKDVNILCLELHISINFALSWCLSIFLWRWWLLFLSVFLLYFRMKWVGEENSKWVNWIDGLPNNIYLLNGYYWVIHLYPYAKT